MHRIRVRYIIEFFIHILFWAGVYYALTALTTTSFNMMIRTGPNGIQQVAAKSTLAHSWIVLLFLMVFFYSNTLWLFKKVLHYKKALPRVAVIGGWFILIFLLNYWVVNRSIPKPGKVHFADKVETLDTPSLVHLPLVEPPPPPILRTDWPHQQISMALIFLAILAVAIAQFFIKEWIRNDLTRSQAEAHQLAIEIRFLRSQVNPHFLFNTLNNLFSMAQKKGNDELADGISKLSGMMRYMIYESNTEHVYLQKEIEYLNNCIALNKLRYADSEVEVTFSHPPPGASEAVQIAPMLFIPFLENAFKHGISIGHRSCIAMTIAFDPTKLIFTCENTDHSHVRRLEEENTGIGLANVRRRLELVYPGKYELHALSKDGKYSVHLQIDLS
jgi:two-component system, LytTR family, sensor kinase